jgi:hypothetical protein
MGTKIVREAVDSLVPYLIVSIILLVPFSTHSLAQTSIHDSLAVMRPVQTDAAKHFQAHGRISFSIPYGILFYGAQGHTGRSNAGFWGISVGAGYWHQENRLYTIQAGIATNTI